MRSLILRTATGLLMPLILLFSVFLLIRGHNHPGGGFIGGMVAGAAFALYAMANDVAQARRALTVDPRLLLAGGLLLAGLSGAIALALGQPYLTGLWWEATLPFLGSVHLGTPLLFDIGVYLVVAGMVTSIVFTLGEA